jgi:hypothetical protein
MADKNNIYFFYVFYLTICHIYDMDMVVKLLAFLRITDENGQLSLTQLALWVVLIKLAIMPTTSLADLGALLVGLANYTGKKIISKGTNV